MRVISFVACLVVAFVCEQARAGASHACSSDAVNRANYLLRFRLCAREEGKDILVFSEDKDGVKSDCLDKIGGWSVDNTAKKIGTVPVSPGRRRYDVLQVWGYVGKGGRYRMRFYYAVAGRQCVLVGEEIFEDTTL